MNKKLKRPKKKPKLLPCPFCGGDADIYAFQVFEEYSVRCESCDAGYYNLETIQEGVKLWNTRTGTK